MAKKHQIGIVGAGTIVRYAHLPTYSELGLPVRAIYDVDPKRTQDCLEDFPEAQSAASVEEIVGDPEIDIVDIAITPTDQIPIARQAIEAGKHLLCQKPLAPDLEEARKLVAFAEERGVKLAVNQQMRWESIVIAIKDALEDGTIGTPTMAQIETNLNSDFPAGHWLTREPRLMGLYGCIHFLDASRFLFGEPQRVTARLSKDPKQSSQGETWINVWVEWPNGLCLVIFERYTNWAGDQTAKMRVEGANGAIRGRFGIWDRYPQPSVDTVERIVYGEGQKWEPVLGGKSWMPDAFVGPIGGLIEAIDNDTEPPTGGADNLKTLRLVEALYVSSEERRAVRPEEIAEL